MKRSMTNTKAFASGFLDGFGGVGQVFEPIVGGISIIKESQAPIQIERVRSGNLRRTASKVKRFAGNEKLKDVLRKIVRERIKADAGK